MQRGTWGICSPSLATYKLCCYLWGEESCPMPGTWALPDIFSDSEFLFLNYCPERFEWESWGVTSEMGKEFVPRSGSPSLFSQCWRQAIPTDMHILCLRKIPSHKLSVWLGSDEISIICSPFPPALALGERISWKLSSDLTTFAKEGK